MWWPKLYQVPRPVEDDLLIAHIGLLSGKYNISTYTMVDGKEIRVQQGIPPMIDGFKKLVEVAESTMSSIFAAFGISTQSLISEHSGEFKGMGDLSGA